MTQVPLTGRKSSTPWDRLKPVKQDPLESMGFVSKGDTRLLDYKLQESYYNKIVARYMQFCGRHSKNLDDAFASLSLSEDLAAKSGSTANPRGNTNLVVRQPAANSSGASGLSSATQHSSLSPPAPSTELSAILTALRKLREGLLASSASAPSPVFSQRVHVFNIRVAILALHPPSYHPSLLHLLFVLHTPHHPLPQSELVEMTSYMILDLALRQNDLRNAYALRHDARVKYGLSNRNLDTVLHSVATGNWVSFWRVRRKVDGYHRAILYWHLEVQRRLALKAIGRSYMACDVNWILASASGNEMSWEELVKAEDVGWQRDGEKILIRKPKPKQPS